MSQNREVKSTNISNLETTSSNHENRLQSLESNIDSTNLITDAEQKFAKITSGGYTNLLKYWKIRHHVMMASVGGGSGPEAADYEQQNSKDRFFGDPNFTIVSAMQTNAQAYLSNVYFIEQNEQIQFKIKKGENFFWIGTYLAAAAASIWKVYVDGVSADIYGLVDELGNPVPSSFSSNDAATRYGKNFQFYGLDGEEHVITIKNENLSAQEIPLQYVDVGYLSPDYAIDHTMRINAGIAAVNGVPTKFDEGVYTFSEPTEGLTNGYTGMVKIDQNGNTTAVDGLSPAATECKPNELIQFSAGPVTSLKVKNNYAFPDNGICLLQHSNGQTYLFSYDSKSDPTPAGHTLDGIVWQSQPTEDYTPLTLPAGVKRISTITNVNLGNSVNFDVSGAAKKVTLWAARPLRGHYFWFNVVDGVNTQTDPGGQATATMGHQVDILTTDSANDVASKLQAVINAQPEFTASVLANVVTVTNTSPGSVTATASNATGVTVATPTAGVNPAWAVNGWRGDIRIEYWAKPTIQINSSNNKVDFEITVNGITTQHTATVASGCYSEDLIPIEQALVKAMTTAKPINGYYFAKYNRDSQYWTIGVSGDEQTQISFLFASGANAANSIGPTLGFTQDHINKKSYLADVQKQHSAQRVFVADQNFRSTEHPSIKYSWAITGNSAIAEADQLVVDLGLPSYRRQASAGNIFYIFPDDDCCGISLSFMREDISVYVTYQIDDGDITYLPQMSRPNDVANPTKGTVVNSFISFPKGTRKIAIRPEYNSWFQVESSTTYITFFGYRQYFTKPPWESLSVTEKILKCIEVAPNRLFATNYGHNTSLYDPQGSNDNINTIIESGTPEVTNVTVNQTGAFFDVVGNAKNFSCFAAPRPDTTGEQHTFWYNVTDGVNSQNDPGLAGSIPHQIDILLADTQAIIATKTAAVVNAVTGKFTAEIRNTVTAPTVITIKNVSDGNVSPVVNGTLTAGHTLSIENTGTSEWTQNSSTTIFNGRYRQTIIYGAYVDINFTLQGNGGGIGFMCFDSTGTSQMYSIYLSDTTINESTDLIERGSADAASILYDITRFQHMGLKAGTYTLRIRQEHTQGLVNMTYVIYDTVQPQLDATVHSDLANPGQGLAYPINVKRRNFQRYGINQQPTWMTEGLGRVGLVGMCDYLVNTHNIGNYDDSSSVATLGTSNFYSHLYAQQANSYFQYPFVGRSISVGYLNYNTHTTSVTPSLDGVVSSNFTQRESVKNGFTPSATKGSLVRNFVKNLDYPISHSSGLTYNMSNTQGIRNNQKAILVDNVGNKEEVYIASYVSNTSITIKKALTSLSPANIVKILFPGFHVFKSLGNDATTHAISVVEFEPLPLEWSTLDERVSTNTIEEIKELKQSLASVGAVAATVVYQSFEYPFHSDGEQGTALTTEILELTPNASGYALLEPGLKAYKSASGVGITARTVKTKSKRKIPQKLTNVVKG